MCREKVYLLLSKKDSGEIAKKIQSKIIDNKGKVNLNETVELVNCLKNGKFNIQTSKQNYDADVLISTLPLDTFVNQLVLLIKIKI